MEGKTMLYESLLYFYYDSETKCFLDQELIGVINNFIEYCHTKDILDNTNIVETIRLVYDSKNKDARNELKDRLALSDSSLYRFRVNVIKSLDKFISNNYSDKN